MTIPNDPNGLPDPIPDTIELYTVRYRDRPYTDPQAPAFGADPTGQSDSTQALVAAMAHAASMGSGVVRLGDGVFRVSPVGLACLRIPAGLQMLQGAGQGRTTILVADGVGHYESVFTSNGNDVSGLAIADLTIDQGANPLGEDVTPLFDGKPRYAIYLTKSAGDNVIERVTFKRIAGVNTVAITGLTRRARVHGCAFHYIAGQPKDYDHSSIYVNAPNYADSACWITDNVFVAPNAARGARTAIETHGGHQVVSGNHGFGVQKFMNISGVTTTPGSGTHVFANSCTGCKFGINLWSLPYAANTGPVGLANVHIHDNTLRVNGPAWKEVCGNGLANGILLNAQSSLRVENLAVHHNHIVFATPEETGYKGEAGDALASGIEYRRASLDPAVVDQNVSFCDNTITNPTANGIRVVVLGNAFDISRNTIVNPGAGCVAAGGQVPNTSANGITILGALTDSRVNDNRVLDTRSSPAVNSGIVVLPTAPGSAGNEAIGNVVPVTKGRSIEVASGWFLRMDQPVVSLPCGPARVGSQLVDRSTGLVYRQGAAPEGTSWTAHVPGRVGVSGLDFAVPGVLRLPGLANNFVMTPAVAAMDMKGAFRLRVELALDDWEATTYVLTRWSGGVALWNLYVSGNRVHLAALIGSKCAKSGLLQATPGQRLVLEAIVDPTTGSVVFNRSVDGGGLWSPLGTCSNTIGGPFALPAGTGLPLCLGGFQGASANWLKGKVHAVDVYDQALAATVAHLDLSTPAAEMIDAQGRAWTVQGSAWTVTPTLVGSVNGQTGSVWLASDGPAATPGLRSLGVGPQQAARGDDPRLSPTAYLPARAAASALWVHVTGLPFMIATGSAQKSANAWHFMPAKIAADLALSALAVTTTVAASGGTAVALFGLFALDGAGRPATRVADWSVYGGLNLTGAVGPKVLATPGLIVPAGEYALGWAWAGTATTAPTLSTLLGMHPSIAADVPGVTATAYMQKVSGASVPSNAAPNASPTAGVVVWGKLA